MRQANGLLQLLEEAKWEITRWAKPLGVLLERLRKETEPLAYEAPERPDGDNLRKQLDIIKYYLRKASSCRPSRWRVNGSSPGCACRREIWIGWTEKAVSPSKKP